MELDWKNKTKIIEYTSFGSYFWRLLMCKQNYVILGERQRFTFRWHHGYLLRFLGCVPYIVWSWMMIIVEWSRRGVVFQHLLGGTEEHVVKLRITGFLAENRICVCQGTKSDAKHYFWSQEQVWFKTKVCNVLRRQCYNFVCSSCFVEVTLMMIL